jgi:Domain of unknown function (DUF4954)
MTTEFELAKAARVETTSRVEKILKIVQQLQQEFLPPDASASATFSLDNRNWALRYIHNDERDVLKERCRCHFDKSAYILVLASEQEEASSYVWEMEKMISETRFSGWVVLDFTDTTTCPNEKVTEVNECYSLLPPGIHSNTLISESIITMRNSRVYKNTVISRTYIGADATVVNCGQIIGPKERKFGCDLGQLVITVGAESGGGRHLVLTAEASMKDVTKQLQQPTSVSTTSSSKLPLTIFSDGGILVRDTASITNVFMSSGASIEAACSVRDSLLFPNAKITNGSIVSKVMMQWETSITDNSKLNNVMMMEESHCGPSSIVESTVMGPDSHASAGEIHASIFGPNTNAHHQSLLIGVLWPLGRGNVGYGANVGSNHTGRLPDQEATPGEGIFWGLSSVIKFPVDLTWAPYSIVAAGTKMLPSQRIGMPFSLIVENGDSNEIIPGWVLQSSPYTLARNDKKYATRRKAKRHAYYTGWKIFRPATIEMCRNARSELKLKEEYPLDNVGGIGSNQLTERGRDIGIRAYTSCIRRYALRGLLRWANEAFRESTSSADFPSIIKNEFGTPQTDDLPLEMLWNFHSVRWPSFPWDEEEALAKEWNYQRGVILEEFPISDAGDAMSWLNNLLENCVYLEQDFASRVAKSKARDDTKGSATIPGYAESHVQSENDAVVVEAQLEARQVVDGVQKLLAALAVQDNLRKRTGLVDFSG